MSEAIPRPSSDSVDAAPLPPASPGSAPLPASPATAAATSSGRARGRRRGRRLLRFLGRGALALLVLLVVALAAAGLWVRGRLLAALPQVRGERQVAGIGARVAIERDRQGVPVIRAGSRRDAAFATGFVHASDRYFQMDLTRRRAAGELAELLGPGLLPADRQARRNRFRAQAERLLARLPAGERELLDAYAAGANAGLAALGERPFEYLLLRARPAPWRPEDSFLVLDAMFLMLQDGRGRRETALGLMHETLPAPLYAFLTPQGTEWDAPLLGGPLDALDPLNPQNPLRGAPIPGPEVFDARRLAAADVAAAEKVASLATAPRAPGGGAPPAGDGSPARATSAPRDTLRDSLSERDTLAERGPLALGGRLAALEAPATLGASNAWAVAGSQAAGGRALLAVDMHLQLSVPNIWYRAAVSWPEGPRAGASPAPVRRVAGVTLPGVPLVVAGSNGAVAWGFTSGRFDASDVVLLECPPGPPGPVGPPGTPGPPGAPAPASGNGDTYLAPGGPRPFTHFHEVLHVRGAADEPLDVRWTIWGPEIEPDTTGRRRAIRWVAHDDAAVNLDLAALETAGSVAEAMAVAWRSGIPAENFVVADAAGHIGWTVAGRLPRRQGFDGRTPGSWSDGSRRWDGLLAAADVPRVVDPPAGRVWSANNRPVGGAALALLGDGGYILGARAGQIRDDLLALPRASAADMLRIQLDDRARFLERWRALLLRVLSPEALAADPRRRALRQAVLDWGGRAAAGSVGYRVVHDFREVVARRVFAAVTVACRRQDPKLDFLDTHDQWEGPLWRLVSERPPNFADPRYHGWDEELLAAADEVRAEPEREGMALASWTWGRHNTAAIRNLLSGALPVVGRLLEMPAVPLDGDDNMPRVQAPAYGASERIVVSPGAEEQGFFTMPGGESADPISPHYRDGEAAWVRGAAAPFLPGVPVDTLTLVPLGSRQGAAARKEG